MASRYESGAVTSESAHALPTLSPNLFPVLGHNAMPYMPFPQPVHPMHPHYPPYYSHYPPHPMTPMITLPPQPVARGAHGIESKPTERQEVQYPTITTYFRYLDAHPSRSRDNINFSQYSELLVSKKWVRMSQLVSPRLTLEKLCEILHIEEGTADLLLTYAAEDKKDIENGTLKVPEVD
jgi:hypothetical protein